MSTEVLSLILILVVAAIIVVGFELYASAHPQYRKGCNECDAVQRRAAEQAEELAHDYDHKIRGECNDKMCKRNTPTE